MKIDYPILHIASLDQEIQSYVKKQKEIFLRDVDELKKRKEHQKYDLSIQYQMVNRDGILFIHLTTYSYTGGNHSGRSDHSYYYDTKQNHLLKITDFLANTETSLERLSVLAYFYVMQYGRDHQLQFDDTFVKDGVSAQVDNFSHFTFEKSGIEFLFPPYQVSSWSDGEVRITIPYTDINPILKSNYQQKQQSGQIDNVIVQKPRDISTFAGKKLIAFTFDDGPSSTTNQLLDGLSSYNAKVTFFVLGSRVAQNQQVIKRAYQEGNQIGSHTYNHRNLLLLDDYTRMNEIKSTNEAIYKVIGTEPRLLRPPYGNINAEIKKLAGMHIIQWNIDPLDWKYQDKNKIASEIVNHAHDGAIVLLHDIYQTSVEGALLAMSQLEQQGYAFVTIDEMAKIKNIALDEVSSYFHF